MTIAGLRRHAAIARHGLGCALAAIWLVLALAPAAADDREPTAPSTASAALQPAAAVAAAEVAAPNCLLPGQIRSLGGIALVTPRRPVLLAPAECAERGGEPIADTATTQ
jgi:hypothetical protein